MDQCSPLGWLHYNEEEDKAELKRLLVQTTAELEATILAARDEISRKEQEIVHMRNLLVAAFKERDEANHQFHKLLKLIPQAISNSDSEESVVSEIPSSPTLSPSLPPHIVATLGKLRPLPEKGKLLEAMMEAGPTLETLMLAGQLPRWERPPPQLDRIEIPPVTIACSFVQPRSLLLTHEDSIGTNNCCIVNPNTNNYKKRALDSFDGPVSTPISFPKYQRVVQTS